MFEFSGDDLFLFKMSFMLSNKNLCRQFIVHGLS